MDKIQSIRDNIENINYSESIPVYRGNRVDSFSPVTPLEIKIILKSLRASSSALDPCIAQLMKNACETMAPFIADIKAHRFHLEWCQVF